MASFLPQGYPCQSPWTLMLRLLLPRFVSPASPMFTPALGTRRGAGCITVKVFHTFLHFGKPVLQIIKLLEHFFYHICQARVIFSLMLPALAFASRATNTDTSSTCRLCEKGCFPLMLFPFLFWRSKIFTRPYLISLRSSSDFMKTWVKTILGTCNYREYAGKMGEDNPGTMGGEYDLNIAFNLSSSTRYKQPYKS